MHIWQTLRQVTNSSYQEDYVTRCIPICLLISFHENENTMFFSDYQVPEFMGYSDSDRIQKEKMYRRRRAISQETNSIAKDVF